MASLKTIGELLTTSVQFLQQKGRGRARRAAEDLLAHVLGLQRVQLYMQFDRPLQPQEVDAYRLAIKRFLQDEPLEYILQEMTFFHCHLAVNRSVLIPRPETELLLSSAVQALRPCAHKVAWDLCTGSGALGIGLKKAIPSFQVTLSDLSCDALEVAVSNAQRNAVEVQSYQGDLLIPFAGMRADVVLCNPPYVSQAEYERLDPSVRLFEPKIALVAGETGLEMYERLARELPHHLHPGAKVFFEIGHTQQEALGRLFQGGGWTNARFEKDLAGHPRFLYVDFSP